LGNKTVTLTATRRAGKKIPGFCRGRERGKTNVIAGLCVGDVSGFYASAETTNTERFLLWLKTYLIPAMRHAGKKIIVFDSASFRTSKRIENLLRRHGMTSWYLPKYSPDFNPIEHYWAWLKRKLVELGRGTVAPDFSQRLEIAKSLPYRSIQYRTNYIVIAWRNQPPALPPRLTVKISSRVLSEVDTPKKERFLFGVHHLVLPYRFALP
jgi:transposase